jgi:ABC-type amino acid transport system permease subunit
MKFELWPTLAAHYWALTTSLSLVVSGLERRLPVRSIGHD